MNKPDVGMLGNWLLSWVQDNGAIHGFHNHSVWGSNPYRWSDFTCGHSTWASPLLPALSIILQKGRNSKLEEILIRLIDFQTTHFQEDGQYDHIGFQMGDTLRIGLIHNMMPNVSLGLTAEYNKSWLPSDVMDSIRMAMVRTMEVCDEKYNFNDTGYISNQEYARLWGKLLYQKAFEDERWNNETVSHLNTMIELFHVRGLPDQDCIASYRYFGDHTSTEPAEYYGLMIGALVLAYEMFGTKLYLEHAGALCRHLARCSWNDTKGQKRLHRSWHFNGIHWIKIKSPMLIAGMGMSLYGIQRYLEHQADDELTDFLKKCDRTYASYQNPGGYFASASGWSSEVDVAPSSAWHTHDFFYLLFRHGADDKLIEKLFESYENLSVLIGDKCMWMEIGPHWTIADFFWQDVFQLFGRKDSNCFGRDMNWVGGVRALPDNFTFPDRPIFIQTEEGMYLKSEGNANVKLDITSIAATPYLGKWSQ